MATNHGRSHHADEPSRVSLPKSVAIGAGAYATVAGLVTLLGWMLNRPRLTDWINSGIAMFPIRSGTDYSSDCRKAVSHPVAGDRSQWPTAPTVHFSRLRVGVDPLENDAGMSLAGRGDFRFDAIARLKLSHDREDRRPRLVRWETADRHARSILIQFVAEFDRGRGSKSGIGIEHLHRAICHEGEELRFQCAAT